MELGDSLSSSYSTKDVSDRRTATLLIQVNTIPPELEQNLARVSVSQFLINE